MDPCSSVKKHTGILIVMVVDVACNIPFLSKAGIGLRFGLGGAVEEN